MNINNFRQVAVWEGTIVGKENVEDFEKFFHDEGFRVKYAKELTTLPDSTGEGGGNDVLFYVHKKDIPKFAVWRLKLGIRWWEDVINNGGDKIIPRNILEDYEYNWN